MSFKDKLLLSTGPTSAQPQVSSLPAVASSPKKWSPQINVVAAPPAANARSQAAASTSNLDDDDLYGENYYSSKDSGAGNRTAGLKLRPDEAKRRDMIVTKKDTQRVKNM